MTNDPWNTPLNDPDHLVPNDTWSGAEWHNPSTESRLWHVWKEGEVANATLLSYTIRDFKAQGDKGPIRAVTFNIKVFVEGENEPERLKLRPIWLHPAWNGKPANVSHLVDVCLAIGTGFFDENGVPICDESHNIAEWLQSMIGIDCLVKAQLRQFIGRENKPVTITELVPIRPPEKDRY